VLAQPPLAGETHALEQPRRRRVAGVALRRHLVQTAEEEQVVQDGAHRLRRVPLAVLRRGQGEADLRLHPVLVQVDPDVADVGTVGGTLDRVLEPAGLVRRAGGEAQHRQLSLFRREGGVPRLKAGDRRVGPVRRQRDRVGRPESAQHQAFRRDQHESRIRTWRRTGFARYVWRCPR
jgi:hypothetical protein